QSHRSAKGAGILLPAIPRTRFQAATEKPDAIHAPELLRPRRERPCRRRTAEQRDEIAPFQTEASRASDRKNSIPLRGRRLLRRGISIRSMSGSENSSARRGRRNISKNTMESNHAPRAMFDTLVGELYSLHFAIV